jgi:hypothetical protein
MNVVWKATREVSLVEKILESVTESGGTGGSLASEQIEQRQAAASDSGLVLSQGRREKENVRRGLPGP